MKKESLDLLKTLLECSSPSGFEPTIQKRVKKEMADIAEEVKSDVRGNVTGVINPNGKPKVMIAGHCDEVGLMVKHITDEGYLYVDRIGCPSLSSLEGQRVNVHTAHGPVPGLVMRKKAEGSEKGNAAPDLKISDFWIDVGAKNRKEAQSLVSLGDPATVAAGFDLLHGDVAVSRAFDDKVGLFVMLETMRALSRTRLEAAVFGVSTVHEEIGGRGALTGSFLVDPDVGIAIDVWFASDYPETDKKALGEIALGKGPVLFKGANINPVVGRMLEETAAKQRIGYQICGVGGLTPTDAAAMLTARGGVATALIGVPVRYMHTPVEVISLKDAENAVKLLSGFVQGIVTGAEFNPVASTR